MKKGRLNRANDGASCVCHPFSDAEAEKRNFVNQSSVCISDVSDELFFVFLSPPNIWFLRLSRKISLINLSQLFYIFLVSVKTLMFPPNYIMFV